MFPLKDARIDFLGFVKEECLFLFTALPTIRVVIIYF
jgi:hypothetical protein